MLRFTIHPDTLEGAQNHNPRDRFTMAHAVAHVVLHGDHLKAHPGQCFRDRSISPGRQRKHAGTDDITAIADWQANTWAASYLVPALAVRAFLTYCAEVGEETPIEALAGQFQVSPEMMEHRLGSLLPRLMI